MNYTSYGLNAYRKEQNDAKEDKKKTESIRSEPRIIGSIQPSQAEPKSKGQPQNAVPIVRKPVFEKIDTRKEAEKIQQEKFEKTKELNRIEQENLRQAKIAANSGTWFEKKKSATSEDVEKAAKTLKDAGLIKVSTPAPGEPESIYRRVAKFLVLIGIDEAAKILPHLTEEQTERIIPEIATIQKIDAEEAEEILAEFQTLLVRARESGGMETARQILSKAYGPVKADDILSKAVQYTQGKPFEYLVDANAERVKILIEGESVGVQAIVLSQIEPEKAAKVINLMEGKQKSDVVLRLVKMKPVTPEVLSQLDKSLHDKMLTQNTENSHNLDGRNVLAEILKRMNPSSETKILSTLAEEDPELGDDLKKRLFTEVDVVNSDDRFIQNRLQDMEAHDIALLIRGKSIDFRKKILTNVSKNRAQEILEEEELIVPVPRAEVERITSIFYAVLRRAWEKGELKISGRDDGEIYV